MFQKFELTQTPKCARTFPQGEFSEQQRQGSPRAPSHFRQSKIPTWT